MHGLALQPFLQYTRSGSKTPLQPYDYTSSVARLRRIDEYIQTIEVLARRFFYKQSLTCLHYFACYIEMRLRIGGDKYGVDGIVVEDLL